MGDLKEERGKDTFDFSKGAYAKSFPQDIVFDFEILRHFSF